MLITIVPFEIDLGICISKPLIVHYPKIINTIPEIIKINAQIYGPKEGLQVTIIK